MLQYTKKAEDALSLAKQTAKQLKQNYIGTEHILLGLLKEDSGVAARVLQDNGVEEGKLMSMIYDLIAPGNFIPVKERDGYTPRAENILNEAVAGTAVSCWGDWNGAHSACASQRRRKCCRKAFEYAWTADSETVCGYSACNRAGWQSLQG